MKWTLVAAIGIAATLGHAISADAQAPRRDALWARSTSGTAITLNGILSEPAWAAAESVVIRYGVDAGIPGSGWKAEAGILPTDPTHATLRFLVVDNQLYMGAVVRDKSVGGSNQFNRFDGLLMAIKDHLDPYRPAPPAEYFYSWYYQNNTPPTDAAPGMLPNFRGRWSECSVSPPLSCDFPRTAEQIANWDAVTTVQGISNDDNNVDGDPNDNNDVGYTVEMRFNLTPLGYDATRAQGDIVEWNGAIYDCDWFWPFQPIFSSNRVWYQGPWGNAYWFHNLRIHCRPDVTTGSGPVPTIGPEIRIPAANAYAAPTINGTLSEQVWQLAPSFDIRYGDDALRASYPSVGPYRSGQYQPLVNEGLAFPLDPGDATVRWFHKGNFLYLGFDVRDQVVQYVANFDRWDGAIITLTEKTTRGVDNQLLARRLSFQVGPTGNAVAQDYLPYLRDTLGGAQLAIALKPGTTVDTVGLNTDQGYTAELAIDLTKLGYPSGLGDGTIFLGINLLDGDSFQPFTDSYSTRTWWFREYEGQDGGPWGYLDPIQQVVGVDGPDPSRGQDFALLGVYPNPFVSRARVRFTLPEARHVTLEIYDLLGRRMASRTYGLVQAGAQHVDFGRDGMKTGLYTYRLKLDDPRSGATATLAGKMILVQ